MQLKHCFSVIKNLLCFCSQLKECVGLENCVYTFSAAAPMQPTTLKFFESIGITVLELYGLSECTGPHTASLKSDGQDFWKFGSCGRGINGAETKIIDETHYNQLNLLHSLPQRKVGEVGFMVLYVDDDFV